MCALACARVCMRCVFVCVHACEIIVVRMCSRVCCSRANVCVCVRGVSWVCICVYIQERIGMLPRHHQWQLLLAPHLLLAQPLLNPYSQIHVPAAIASSLL